jgi:hypothetical protein
MFDHGASTVARKGIHAMLRYLAVAMLVHLKKAGSCLDGRVGRTVVV